MSNDPLHAEAETAWAMAYASDEGLRAMCSIAPQEVVRLAWIMGHYKGKIAGAIAAQVVYAESLCAARRRLES